MTVSGERGAIRRWGPPILVVALGLALYGRTVVNGLVSDDYVWIGVVREGLVNVARYHGGYHYNPVALAFLFLEHALWGTRAVGYHAASLALFLLAALMVARLGRVLGTSHPVRWSAAVLFVGSSLLFEAPLWGIGIFYSLSTLLFVLGFERFLAYRRAPRPDRALAFLGCLVLALLTHEQAINLVLVCLAWTLQTRDRSVPLATEIRERGRIWLVTIGVPGVLVATCVAIKLLMADGQSQAPGLSLGRELTSPLAVNLARVFVPNLAADTAAALVRPPLPEWARWPWRLALVAVGLGVVALAGRRGRFLIAWASIQVGVMVAGIGSMTSRHFVLALVPSSLLAAAAFSRVAEWSARPWLRWGPRPAPWGPRADPWGPRADPWDPGSARVVSVAVFSALVVTCTLIGVTTLTDRIRVWNAASAISERILADVDTLQAQHPGSTRLHALDLPDGLPVHGESEPAYVFRLGFESAVEQRLHGRFELIATLYSVPVAASGDRRVGAPASPEQLRALSADPRNLVVRYESASHRLRVAR